jgi:hypothetical protein
MASLSDFDEEPSPHPKNITAKEGFCAPTEEEIKALRRLDHKKPLKIKVEKELDDCIKNGADWRDHKRQNRQRLRQNLAQIYRLWRHLVAHEESHRVLLKACDRKKIQITARTDVLLALIHLCLRPGGEAAHRYANALRELALEGISAGKLPSHLAKKGQGVNAKAAAYRERGHPKSEDNSADATTDDPTTLADRADKNMPKLQWEDSALAKWQLNTRAKIYLVVECKGPMAGTIVRVRTSLHKKQTNEKRSSGRKK